MFAVYQYGRSGTVREEVEDVDQLIADVQDISPRYHIEVFESKDAYHGGKDPVRVVSTMREEGSRPTSAGAMNAASKAPTLVSQLRACPLQHGREDNSATVFGHGYPSRNCIRLAGTRIWVYDPGWENRTQTPAEVYTENRGGR